MIDPTGGFRRLVITATVAALLGGAAFHAISAAPASAAYGKCELTDFCLFYTGLDTAVYHFDGSDSNLNDNRFEGTPAEIVGNNTRSAWNRGTQGADQGADKDVLVYTKTRFRGARDCIAYGDSGLLPRNWWDSIESYQWVSHRTCVSAGVINLT